MNQAEFEKGSEESSQKLEEILKVIPYEAIFNKIEETEKNIKEIQAEYKGKVKTGEDSAYWGGKVFSAEQEAVEFIREQLDDLFSAARHLSPHHKLWSNLLDLRAAVNKFKFAEIRSVLDKIRAESER